MPIYNLIEYSDAYSKTSGTLWQYYRDEPALDGSDNILYIDVLVNNNNSNSFRFKQQITEQTRNGGTKSLEIMVPLKYQNNFWRTLEMPLINFEITLQLTGSKKSILHLTCSKRSILVVGTAANEAPNLIITNAKLSLKKI